MAGRILIVDDEEKQAYSIIRTLNKAGFETVHATSGNEALEQLQNSKFTAAMIDVRMPEMNGYEVVKRISENAATSKLPVILFSSKEHPRMIREYGELIGITAAVTVPIEPEQIKPIIDAAIIRKSRGSDPAMI